jgi:hypothetical protein
MMSQTGGPWLFRKWFHVAHTNQFAAIKIVRITVKKIGMRARRICDARARDSKVPGLKSGAFPASEAGAVMGSKEGGN